LIIVLFLIFTFFIAINKSTESLAALQFNPPTATAYNGSIGMVSFGFDHAFANQLLAVNSMAKYNFAGTIYVIVTKIDKNGFMTQQNLTNLYNMGWEIASHSMTHTKISDPTSDATLRYEIVNSKEMLIAKGFCVAGYVSPYDKITSKSSTYIKSNYNYTFVPVNKQNTLYTITNDGAKYGFPLVLHHMSVGNTRVINNFDTAKKQIDSAIANKTWLLMNFHGIDYTANGYSTKPELFTQILDYVKQKYDAGQLTVATQAGGLGYCNGNSNNLVQKNNNCGGAESCSENSNNVVQLNEDCSGTFSCDSNNNNIVEVSDGSVEILDTPVTP